MAELPEVTPDFISQSVSDYETTFAKGTEAELSAAKLRLVWALSHAKDPKHNKRGIELADELLRVPQAVPDDCTHREVEYMKAVALFRMGSYIKCRQQCNAILQEHPESRQVVTLKDAADEAIVRDGLIGVGIGLTGVVGVVAALALSAAASRR